jgi:hypothetical protein
MYKLTVVLKTGHRFTNKDLVDQKFVNNIYDMISSGTEGVIQIATHKKVAYMVSVSAVDFIKVVLT